MKTKLRFLSLNIFFLILTAPQLKSQTWREVGHRVDTTISAMQVFNGDLYVAGSFLHVDSFLQSANYIAKWNGTTWSAVGTGMNGYVATLAVYNGKLYAGGEFSRAGGVAAQKAAV